MRVRRTRRAWQRQYRPGLPMVWRHTIVFEDVTYAPGDLIPDKLHADKGWLRSRWMSRLIDFQSDFQYTTPGPTPHILEEPQSFVGEEIEDVEEGFVYDDEDDG